MIRLLLLLLLIALIALVVWSVVRLMRARAETASAEREPYRVLESVGDGHARVEIGRPLQGEAVLIGTVALGDHAFDERYAELVARAEDRAATLNASRSLRSPS